MKRKIFSKLLMVALVIAAVGSFVSCKDYDDDINNLQKQIDAKAALSELTALQSTLDSKIAAAQSAATAAQAKADAAATKTSVDELKKALETAIADAKKAGTDAGTQAGTAIAAANKAQETADAAAAAAKKADEDAKAALADALKTIEETYQTKADAEKAVAGLSEAIAAVKETADAAFTKAEAEKLQEQVNNLKADLEAAVDEKIDEKIKEVNNAVASIDAIWTAVTDIDFAIVNPGNLVNLKYGIQNFTWKFGNKEKELQAYAAMKNPYQYTKGDSIIFENDFIVRATPTNADLSEAAIKLINTQGEDLDEFVNISVKKYEELYTRAGGETGLWIVSVSLKDDVKVADLQKAIHYNKSANTAAVYAIAVNNTEDAAAARFAATEFDLDIEAGPYVPVLAFNPIINGKFLTQIADRWDSGNKYVKAEDGTIERDLPELEWNQATKSGKFVAPVPAVDTTAVSSEFKMWQLEDNGRYSADGSTIMYVAEGDDIVIDFTALRGDIDRYYVLLDTYNAVESNPSEVNAWLGYKITGLDEVKKSTERLTIKIDDAEAVGDVIGFRIYATNYDGSLVDPDGKAFYVRYGDEKAIATTSIPVAFKAVVNDPTAIVAGGDPAVADWTEPELVLADAKLKDWNKTLNSHIAPFKLSDFAKNVNLDKFSGSVSVAYGETNEAVANVATKTTVTINYWLLKSDALAAGKVQLATNAGEVNYVLTSADYVGSWVDNKSASKANQIVLSDPDHHSQQIAKAALAISKIMPSAPEFTWVTGRAPVGGVLSIYPEPLTAAGGAIDYATATAAPAAQFNANQYGILASGLTVAQQANFALTIKKPNSATDTKNQGSIATADFTGTAISDIVPTYPTNTTAGYYANKVFKFNTNYAATCTYNYAGISISKFDKTASVAYEAPVGSPQVSAVKFVDRLDPTIQTYGWNSYTYYVGVNATSDPASTVANRVTKNSSKYFLVWGGVTTAKANAAVAAGTLCKFSNAIDYNAAGTGIALNATWPNIVSAGGNLWPLIWSNNSANLAVGANLLTQTSYTGALANANYATYILDAATPSRYAVKVVANGTQYYTGTLTSAALTLAQDAVVLPPTSNLDAKLYVYATDRFGLNLNTDWTAVADEDKMTPIATLDVKIFQNESYIEY